MDSKERQRVLNRIRGWLKEEVSLAKKNKRDCDRYSSGWNYHQGRLDAARDMLTNLKEILG